MKKALLTVLAFGFLLPLSAAAQASRPEVRSALMLVPWAGPEISILVEMTNNRECTVNFYFPNTIEKVRPSGFRTVTMLPKNYGYVMAARRALHEGSSSDLVEALEDEKSRRKSDTPTGCERDMENLLEMIRKKCD